MLITVGLFILCMENVNFFQPCILCLKQKLTLDHILLYKASQKHLVVF
jgi:disulfide bond formation protein DsbB